MASKIATKIGPILLIDVVGVMIVMEKYVWNRNVTEWNVRKVSYSNGNCHVWKRNGTEWNVRKVFWNTMEMNIGYISCIWMFGSHKGFNLFSVWNGILATI